MASTTGSSETSKPIVIAIVYYSLYGHIAGLAKAIKAGAESYSSDIKVKLYQVPETLSEEILTKMHAPPKDSSIPTITDPSDLLDADAIIFGISTRYGMVPAQMKAFMDSTGKIWSTGGFVGKIASIFFSTATVGGGQETAALSMLPFIAHHGMLFAPIGYTSTKLFELTVHGGSPWGSGTIAGGDGSRKASPEELEVSTHQGKLIIGYASSMKKGKST